MKLLIKLTLLLLALLLPATAVAYDFEVDGIYYDIINNGEASVTYQYDDDVSFTIERAVDAALHVRVYPETEGIDAMARPAVYRDE